MAVGIFLERDSTNVQYLPVAHVSSLCQYQDVLPLSLISPFCSERSGARYYIHVRDHERLLAEAAQQIRERAIVPVEKDLTLDEVLDGYRQEASRWPPSLSSPSILWTEANMICAWAGRLSLAESIIDEGVAMMSGFPEWYQERLGGIMPWRSEAQASINDSDGIRRIVDHQVGRLRLDRLPQYQLIL